jgi:hypothetical protein
VSPSAQEHAFRTALRLLASAGYSRAVILALADDAGAVLLKSTLPPAYARDLVLNVATQIRAGRAGIEVPKT